MLVCGVLDKFGIWFVVVKDWEVFFVMLDYVKFLDGLVVLCVVVDVVEVVLGSECWCLYYLSVLLSVVLFVVWMLGEVGLVEVLCIVMEKFFGIDFVSVVVLNVRLYEVFVEE